MTDNSPEMNARRLKAWNAWKEVCWVHGLGKPRGDNLPIVGTAEDEELLAKAIRNAFLRKLTPFRMQLADSKGNIALLTDLDCAQEFDHALLEYETVDRRDRRFRDDGQIRPRLKKSWKDFVWQSLAASKDPPLKVVNGQLLGPKGIINQVVEDWLLSNFTARFNGEMLEFIRSRDAETVERDEETEQDGDNFLENEAAKAISPDGYNVSDDADDEPCEDAQETSEPDSLKRVPKSWQEELERAFPARLCCLMLAHINGVKIYADKEVLSALGIGKTTAAQNLNKAQDCLSGLNPELRDWIMHDAAGTRFFKKWIESRCRAEKAGALILSRVEEKK